MKNLDTKDALNYVSNLIYEKLEKSTPIYNACLCPTQSAARGGWGNKIKKSLVKIRGEGRGEQCLTGPRCWLYWPAENPPERFQRCLVLPRINSHPKFEAMFSVISVIPLLTVYYSYLNGKQLVWGGIVVSNIREVVKNKETQVS